MLRISQPIATARLILRPFASADLDDVWAYQKLPEVAHHMLWPARTRDQSERAVDQMVTEDALAGEGDCLSLAVVWPDVGRVVGQVELVWLSQEHRQGELGYVFNPRYRGRGLATEAAAEMLRLGFGELDLHRIVGRCSAQNSASARLLERLGMRREAHFIHNVRLKGEWKEELVYAMLQQEWRST
ncbi:GNAT family protein [Micromonospora polyrhachis]|uniref:RimJ/RimL family protein N-acetyltransferase n=1 Tax=Micromonospora polyrhachis TaxID=1282883 RepID=A0A7W7SSC2_9ACTN|nr:GNAT family protein [Micromonospora polyrhachis]MBB4960029.1 RimJ/RimL family protein N-acetyltransferase [Micromonospora polyrhachis]